MIIRPIRETDLDWAINIAARNMIYNELNRPELFNPDQQELLYGIMIRDETAFIAENDSGPIGILGGILINNPLNPELSSLTELIWYITPDSRVGRATVGLIKAYTERGDELGADEITFSLLPESPISDRSMKRYGYNFVEKSYRRGYGSN